jgi:hypothetical protein
MDIILLSAIYSLVGVQIINMIEKYWISIQEKKNSEKLEIIENKLHNIDNHLLQIETKINEFG